MSDIQRYSISSSNGDTELKYELPDFMLEATAQKILEIAEMQADIAGVDKKTLGKLFETIKKGVKADEKSAKENATGLAAIKKAFQSDFAQQFNKNMEQSFRFLSSTVQTVLTSIGAVGLVAGGVVYTGMTNLGRALSKVTDVGLAFSDGLNVGSESMRSTILGLNRLGLSTDEATDAIVNYSRVFAVGGLKATTDLMAEFFNLSENGKKFGQTIFESKETLLSELQARSRMVDISRLDQTRLSANIINTSLNLQKFASILGTSQKALLANSQSIIDGNATFQNFISGISDPDTRDKLRDQALNLISGLTGVFGDAGAELANALADVAGTGMPQLNETFKAMSYINRDFYDAMVKTSDDLRNGKIDITGDGLADRFQSMMNTFSGSEADMRSILISMGMEGSQVAQMMAGLSMAADVAGKDLDKLRNQTPTFDELQKGILSFENALRIFKGSMASATGVVAGVFGPTFESVGNRLETEMGPSGSLMTALHEGGKRILGAISSLFDINLLEDGTVTGLDGAVKWLEEKITSISKWIEDLILSFEGKDPAEVLSSALLDLSSIAVGAIATGITKGIEVLFSSDAVKSALAKAITALLAYSAGKAAVKTGIASLASRAVPAAATALAVSPVGLTAAVGAALVGTTYAATKASGFDKYLGEKLFDIFGNKEARDFRANLNSPPSDPTQSIASGNDAVAAQSIEPEGGELLASDLTQGIASGNDAVTAQISEMSSDITTAIDKTRTPTTSAAQVTPPVTPRSSIASPSQSTPEIAQLRETSPESGAFIQQPSPEPETQTTASPMTSQEANKAIDTSMQSGLTLEILQELKRHGRILLDLGLKIESA